jgi:hypothetical protein
MFGLSPLLYRKYIKFGSRNRHRKKIYKIDEQKLMRIKFLTNSQRWKKGRRWAYHFEKPSLKFVVSISNGRESKRG